MSDAARFVAAVVVFVFRGERLLAMRRSADNDAAPGKWEALSGRIQPGEQPIETAARETREECGLEIRLRPEPLTAYLARRNRDEMIVIVYRADSDEGEVQLSAEHDRCEWMTPDDFATACRFPRLVAAARLAAGAG